ncbi:hypothetical protein [Fluviicola sp.]|uniref:hypothetical protein n=1 Tax=Fluviicola sp. TaxID=1917219 RepID=UPI0026094D73|nr:hypothetical protein [Fluviicola sp.]
MRTYFVLILLFSCIGSVSSCHNDKNQQNQKTTRQLTAKERADNERASFDKLPNHNDSVVGCWLIDSVKSVRLREDMDIDALFFLKEHKKLVILDSSKYNEFEEKIGFFRFYNNELTFEINTEEKPFQYKWNTILTGENIVAQNKKDPKAFLYLTKVDRKSSL